MHLLIFLWRTSSCNASYFVFFLVYVSWLTLMHLCGLLMVSWVMYWYQLWDKKREAKCGCVWDKANWILCTMKWNYFSQPPSVCSRTHTGGSNTGLVWTEVYSLSLSGLDVILVKDAASVSHSASWNRKHWWHSDCAGMVMLVTNQAVHTVLVWSAPTEADCCPSHIRNKIRPTIVHLDSGSFCPVKVQPGRGGLFCVFCS